MSQIFFFMADSCRKLNLESNRVLKLENWFNFNILEKKKIG
jgi:hypothetical protein